MITRLETVPAELPRQTRHDGVQAGLVDFAAVLRTTWPALSDFTVLDVGAGDGWLATFLGCRRYIGLDPQAWGADVLGDAHALPFGDRAVDLVVSKQTLPHFGDPATACQEMTRVAREGVAIRQEFPDVGPIGWEGHSRCRIDAPLDIIVALVIRGKRALYTGRDFLVWC